MAGMEDLVFLDSDGATQITEKDLGDVLAGAIKGPVKLGVQYRPIGSLDPTLPLLLRIEGVGVNDGDEMMRIGPDAGGTISPPGGLTATPGATGDGGGWAAIGQPGWGVTALTGTGETGPALATATIDNVTQRVTLAWDALPGATGGFKVYRTGTPGVFATPALRTTLAAGVTSYIDDGGAVTAGAPPATNTTGGGPPDYGTPGTMSADDILLGVLTAGASVHFWLEVNPPGATTAQGNDRQAALRVIEVTP